MIAIRRLRTGEADLYKQLRLAALQEAPYAFSSTYASALERSAESWRDQAERTAHGTDRATFIAFSDDKPIGLAALYRLEDQAGVGEVAQVWVTPASRGTGVAGELMDALYAWAEQNGFRTLIARVTAGDDRAIQFYRKGGFARAREFSPSEAEGVVLVRDVGEK